MLTVEPRTAEAKADVTFILADGTTARLRFVTVRPNDKVKADTLYDLKNQREMLDRRIPAQGFILWANGPHGGDDSR